jgi:hypothetical protein
MSKILLVDTNFSSAPIYKELLKKGHEVHVVGGNPEDYLAKLCKIYYFIDYSIQSNMSKLLQDQKYDYIIPGCTDRSYTACVDLALGQYPGIETDYNNRTINNKFNFKYLAKFLGILTPQIQEDEMQKMKWPLIVKPVDSYSGKGITVLTKSDLVSLHLAKQNALAASISGKYIIEEYITGQLFSHSAFLSDGEVIVDFIVREDCTANPFVVDTSYVIPNPPKLMLKTLRFSIEKIAQHLELKNGLLHTQFIYNSGKVWLIEMTRRCPGDLYSQLIELSTGYPYCESYVRSFLGLPPLEPVNSNFYSPIMRHTVTVKSEQFFGHLHYKNKFAIERWYPLALCGSILKPSPTSRVGILFASPYSKKNFNSLYQLTLRGDLYEVVS